MQKPTLFNYSNLIKILNFFQIKITCHKMAQIYGPFFPLIYSQYFHSYEGIEYFENFEKGKLKVLYIALLKMFTLRSYIRKFFFS